MSLFISNSKRVMKRIVVSLLILCALFAGMTLTLHRSGYIKQYKSDLRQGQFWMQKAFAKPVYDVVICGDSRVYRGVSPAVFADIGLNVLNFGFSSVILDRFYLDNAKSKLDPGGKRILLIGLSSHSFVEKENEALKSYLKESYSSLDSYVLPNFPSIDFRSFFKILRGKYSSESDYEQTFFDDGWVASNRVGRENSALSSYIHQFESHGASEKKVLELAAYIKSQSKQGITFVVFRTPTSLEMEKLEDEHSGASFARIKATLKSAGAKWIDVSELKLRSYDGSHLDKRSAKELSSYLIQNI